MILRLRPSKILVKSAYLDLCKISLTVSILIRSSCSLQNFFVTYLYNLKKLKESEHYFFVRKVPVMRADRNPTGPCQHPGIIGEKLKH